MRWLYGTGQLYLKAESVTGRRKGMWDGWIEIMGK